MKSLSPEQQDVLACIRRAFGLPASDPTSIVDWSRVLSLVRHHNVAALCHRGLGVGSAAPAEVSSALRLMGAEAVLRSKVWAEPTLQLTIRTLQGAGLDPIVLKGAGLAYVAYPRPSDRSFGDIDILLPDHQLAEAGAALVARGFQVAEADVVPEQHLVPYLHPGSPLCVELHHKLLHGANEYRIDMERFAARSVTAEIAGLTARIPAPEDALLHACLHLGYGHRYQFFPLRNITDILAIARGSASLDWEVFLEIVDRSRTHGAVYWALALARQWLGAPIPRAVLAEIAPPRISWRLMSTVVDASYVLEARDPPPGTWRVYNLLMDLSFHGGHSLADQAGYLGRSLFPRPQRTGHLPPEITRSPVRYAATLADPRRLWRGLTSLGLLLTRRPTHSSVGDGHVLPIL